jgi:light-regulated signal transduction histidine kinase (bacteriophytochrome)
MMAQDYADKLDEEAKKLFALLTGRAQRMNDLLDAVIEYSEVGRLVYKEEQVDINKLVQRTIGEIASPENIEITIEGELPVITCGEQHLVLVFKNLIGNAVIFMDKAKGKITISCTEKTDSLTFNVTDNGPGIEQKYFAKIFRPFQTLNPRDEIKTAGVGLALVKKTVDMYDGAVWVESDPGKGSTFFFALPKRRTGNNMRLQNASAGSDNC